MANDFSNIKTTVYQRFLTRLSEVNVNFREWSKEVTGAGYSLSRGDVYGGSDLGTSSSPSSTDVDTGKSDTTRTYYYALQSLDIADIDDNPEILMEIADTLVWRAGQKMSAVMYAALAAADTTAHPENGGNYTASGGGTVYFADVFATPVSQQNLFTSALSASSLDAAITAAVNYKDKSGKFLGMNGNFQLVVPPALRTTAKELTAGDEGKYDGTGISNRFGDMVTGVTVAPHLTDANDWFLIQKDLSPIKHWMRERPTLEVTRGVSDFQVHLKLKMAFDAVLEPYEGGLIMNKVA